MRTDPGIIAGVSDGDWPAAKAALVALGNNPNNYDYYIDRMILLDASGTVQVAYPGIAPAGIGKTDDAYNEWYGPLVQNGAASYVTDVYTRSVAPQTNLVEILAPIRNAGTLVGFFELTIPINEFSDFGKDADPGSTGFAYFVNRVGDIITHPKYSSDGPIINYSSLPAGPGGHQRGERRWR